MKFALSLIATFFFSVFVSAQTPAPPADPLPFREVPTYPDSFTAETAVARMVDGLGFRFYWATEGLRPEDLAWRPTPESRSCEETIDHIMGLVRMLALTVDQKTVTFSEEATSPLPFVEKRKKTLDMLWQASQQLRNNETTRLQNCPIVIQRGEKRSEFPFWNMLNGPLADALWHVGQVVSFRRSSGNPISSQPSFFTGTVRK